MTQRIVEVIQFFPLIKSRKTKKSIIMTQKRVIILGVIVAMITSAGVFYACKKDGNGFMNAKGSLTPSVSNGMRVFNSMEELFNEINRLDNMEEEVLETYENSIGFQSFGRMSESVYWQILREIGEEHGYNCELGAEEMSGADIEFTAEDAQVYLSQYPQYLELCSKIVEGEEEYEFLPKYSYNQFRYVMNNDRMFQVEETVYKVFKNAVIYTSIGNVNALYSITEDNIENVITDIEIQEEAGNEGPIFAFTYSKGSQKCGGNKGPYITEGTNGKLEMANGSMPGTPGCSNKSTGTLFIYAIEEVASQPSPNNKERVVANFYCDSYDIGFGRVYWETNAYYSVYAEWRGGKHGIWIHCKRTLNSDICMEVWQKYIVYSCPDNYKSPKGPEKAKRRELITQQTTHDYDANGNLIPALRGSIYNLTGRIWIATASYTFDFGGTAATHKGR